MAITETLASPEFITMASEPVAALAALAISERSAINGDRLRLRLRGMARPRPSTARRESFMGVCISEIGFLFDRKGRREFRWNPARRKIGKLTTPQILSVP